MAPAFIRSPARRRQLPAYSKLKIDWSHPLASGLVSCWIPGAAPVDICQEGLDLSINGTTGSFRLTADGPALATNNNAGLITGAGIYGLASGPIGSVHPLRNWSSLTMYYRGYANNSGGVGQTGSGTARLFAIEYDNANGSPFLVAGMYCSSATAISAGWNSAGSFTNASIGTITSTVNTLFSAAATFNVGGNVVSYINGAQQNSTSFGASSPNSSATSFVDILGENCTGSSSSQCSGNAVTNLAAIWNRSLSSTEIAFLDQDPYSFLLPDEGEWPALYIATASTVAFRRTLSRLGTRAGDRQVHH